MTDKQRSSSVQASAESRAVVLASPIFPSGVTWLLNVLLELDIKIYRGDEESCWFPTDNGHRLAETQDELRQWLPALSDRTTFRFETPLTVEWTHEFPALRFGGRPVIVFVRQGMDALYSYYRRWSPPCSLLDFLRKPFAFRLGVDRTGFALSSADTWALFVLLWWRWGGETATWVRFEDSKREPERVARSVLETLSLQRDQAAVQTAVERSTFERARQCEAEYRRTQGLNGSVINRAGKVGETDALFGARERTCFAGLPALALKTFGYETGELPDSTPPALPWLCDDPPVSARLGSIRDLQEALLALACPSLEDPALAFQAGLALAGVRWTALAFGERRISSPPARRFLRALWEFLPHTAPRPVAVAQAALALTAAGAREPALMLLRSATADDESGYERLALAGAFLELEARAELRASLDAVSDVEMETGERLFWLRALATRGCLGVGWRFLGRTGRRSRPMLLADEGWQLAKRVVRWAEQIVPMHVHRRWRPRLRYQGKPLPPLAVDNTRGRQDCPLCGGREIRRLGRIEYESPPVLADTPLRLAHPPELWTCESCESWFTQFAVPPDVASACYARKTSEKWTSPLPFEAKHPPDVVEHLRRRLRPGGHVLDIGCAQGDLLDFAAALGCRTSGVEPSAADRWICTQAGHACYPTLEAVPSGTRFDAICAFDVVEHVYDPTAFLRACAARLAPDGRLWVLTGDNGASTARICLQDWWYVRYADHVVFPAARFFEALGPLLCKASWPTHAWPTVPVSRRPRPLLTRFWRLMGWYDGRVNSTDDHRLYELAPGATDDSEERRNP